MLSGSHRSGFFPVSDKVVEPENIDHAKIDPLQPHTSVAALLLLGADPDNLSSRYNRAMIFGQMNVEENPITYTYTHILAGANKNAKRADIFRFTFGRTALSKQTIWCVDMSARITSVIFHGIDTLQMIG